MGFYKLHLYLPDGSNHTLRLKWPSLITTVTAFITWTRRRNPSTGTGCPTGSLTTDLTYYTTDGSYISVKSVHHQYSYWTSNPWTIYFPDGRTVQGAGADATSISDKNGNTVSITNIDNVTGTFNVFAERCDRKAHPDPERSEPGHDNCKRGIRRVFALQWTVQLGIGIHGGGLVVCDFYGDLCGGGGTETAVQSISLPTGLSYSFGYDTGGWGQLNSVTLPSGATVGYATWVGYGSSTYGYQLLSVAPVHTRTLTWTDGDSPTCTTPCTPTRTETSTYSFTTTTKLWSLIPMVPPSPATLFTTSLRSGAPAFPSRGGTRLSGGGTGRNDQKAAAGMAAESRLDCESAE